MSSALTVRGRMGCAQQSGSGLQGTDLPKRVEAEVAAQESGPGHVHQGLHGHPRPCSPQNSGPPKSAWAGFWRPLEREGTVSLP